MNNKNVFAEASYRGEMLELFGKLLWPGLKQKFELIFDQPPYSLANLLGETSNPPEMHHILQQGAGEGFFLYRLAGLLEERNLTNSRQITLTGLDASQALIETATQFSQVAKPPRPYLEFYVQKTGQPLEQQPELRLLHRQQFSFIFSVMQLTVTPIAQQQLNNLYQHLAPGGVIYVRDYINKPGPEGWIPAHPAVEKFSQLSAKFVASFNEGIDVTEQIPGWLKSLGATNINTETVILPYGGETKLGLEMLRFLILYIRYMGPLLVQYKLMSSVEYDNMLNTIYRELSPSAHGQIAHMDIIATKPT